PGRLLRFLDPDAAVLELPGLRLQADGPPGRHRERLLQHLAVAGALGGRAPDGDLQLVPAAGVEALEGPVRPPGRVVAHLELFAADVDAAVGPRRGAELQLEVEVLGELAGGRQLPDPGLAPVVLLADGDHASLGPDAAVGRGGLAVQRLRRALVAP